MALPGNLTTVTVTIDYTGAGGIGDGGYVSFAPPMDILDPSGAAIISRTPAVATLIGGVASITLPATDDTDMNPTGWGYTVVVALSGLSYTTEYVGVQLLSSYAPSIDLSAILPPGVVTPPTPTTYGALATPNTWAGKQTYQQGGNGAWLGTRISGDTQDRFGVDLNGKHQWGPGGSAAFDTDLYRSGVGALKTDGTFTAAAFGPATGATDWINAKSPLYGAVGDGVTDDATAINNALLAANTAGGGTVYLPWTANGYLVTGSINIPPMVTLRGQVRATLGYTPSQLPALSRIVAAASWAPGSSAGIVEIRSMTAGGWTSQNFWSGLDQIMIDGHLNANTNLNAIRYVGPCFDTHLTDVMLYKAPHNGVTAATQSETGIGPTFPWHQRWTRVAAYVCGFRGFDITNFTDSEYVGCMAFQNSSHGWNITNVGNSSFAQCRAEWNSGSGFFMTGAGTGITMTGCTTDQNTQRGIYLNAVTDASGQITIVGYKGHADGHDGTSAGIEIASTTVPVSLTGCMVSADVSSSVTVPVNGAKVSGSTNVTLVGGTLAGQAAGLNNAGSNTNLVMSDVIEMVGNIGAQLSCPTNFAIAKTSDQTVNNSSTLANDTALLTPTLPPNSTWEVICQLIYDGSTAGDIKLGWAHPTSSTFAYNAYGSGTGAAGGGGPYTVSWSPYTVTSTPAFGGQAVGNNAPIGMQGILTVTTAGVLQLQWAQNTPDATNLTVHAGSYLKLKRIS